MADYNVIVVGAGNAALAAAVSAKENGASVLVLEKAPKEMRGGNTHWSGGMFRFAYGEPSAVAPLIPEAEKEIPNFYEGINPYTPDDFHGDLMKVTNGRTDPVLSRIIVEESKDTVFWMHRVGKVKMEPATAIAAVKKGNNLVWLRGLVVRAIHEGAGLSACWFSTCEEMGIEIRYKSAVIGLDVGDDDGAVRGVKVRDDDGIKTISADGVILACGGFEANVEMRTQYIGPLLGEAKVRGTPHNQGDGIRIALNIGAMPWGQWSGCHATPISADWGEFAPRPMTDRSNRLSYPYSLMLNRRGQRFVDEGENTQMMTYAKFGRAILAQPGGKVYQIFDASVVHLLEKRYGTSKPIVADTLEGLIEQLDIEDKAQAVKTIREYNAAIRNLRGVRASVGDTDAGGTLDEVVSSAPNVNGGLDPLSGWDPSKLDGLATEGLATNKTNWAKPIAEAPFYAYSATGGITFTFGGLKINKQAEVIGTDWRPIQGLYACGELVGGLYYDNYPAGTGLVSGATFGRIAGRNAALKTPMLSPEESSPEAFTGASDEVHGENVSAPNQAGASEGWVP